MLVIYILNGSGSGCGTVSRSGGSRFEEGISHERFDRRQPFPYICHLVLQINQIHVSRDLRDNPYPVRDQHFFVEAWSPDLSGPVTSLRECTYFSCRSAKRTESTKRSSCHGFASLRLFAHGLGLNRGVIKFKARNSPHGNSKAPESREAHDQAARSLPSAIHAAALTQGRKSLYSRSNCYETAIGDEPRLPPHFKAKNRSRLGSGIERYCPGRTKAF